MFETPSFGNCAEICVCFSPLSTFIVCRECQLPMRSGETQAGHQQFKEHTCTPQNQMYRSNWIFCPFRLTASSVEIPMRCLTVSRCNSLSSFNLIWEIKVVTVPRELLLPHEVFSCYFCVSFFFIQHTLWLLNLVTLIQTNVRCTRDLRGTFPLTSQSVSHLDLLVKALNFGPKVTYIVGALTSLGGHLLTKKPKI